MGLNLSLANTNSINATYPILFSIETKIITCRSNSQQMNRRIGDSLILEAFIIPTDVNLNNITNFEIQFNDHITWNIPFELFLNAKFIKTIDDNNYITIDQKILGNSSNKKNKYFEIFLKDLTNIKFMLNSKNDFSYEILTIDKFYNPSILRTSTDIHKEHDINQYQIFDITSERNYIKPYFVSCGLYVKTYDRLIGFKLLLNGITYINRPDNLIKYKKNLINKREMWTKKHSLTLKFTLNKILPFELIEIIENYAKPKIMCEYLYYFSFCQIGNMIDNDLSTINFSGVNETMIELMTENNYYDGKIYVKNKNKLISQNYVSYLKFSR